MGIVSTSTGGGSGSGALLFDSTLGAPAATIDTGAAGVAGTQNLLEIHVLARTTQAVPISSFALTLNNDGTAIYERVYNTMTNNVVTGANELTNTGGTFNAAGATAAASIFSSLWLVIPSYAQTTAFKVGTYIETVPDTAAANTRVLSGGFGYRATAAISRVAITAGGASNFATGTRLLILGR